MHWMQEPGRHNSEVGPVGQHFVAIRFVHATFACSRLRGAQGNSGGLRGPGTGRGGSGRVISWIKMIKGCLCGT